jgi:hypothetical protein
MPEIGKRSGWNHGWRKDRYEPTMDRLCGCAQTLRNEDAGSLQQDSEAGQSPTGFAFHGLRFECGRLLMPRALQLNSLPSAARALWCQVMSLALLFCLATRR